MRPILFSLLFPFFSIFRSRTSLQLEIIALRHQLEVLQRKQAAHARFTCTDRTS
jgi:hypothetical protein